MATPSVLSLMPETSAVSSPPFFGDVIDAQADGDRVVLTDQARAYIVPEVTIRMTQKSHHWRPAETKDSPATEKSELSWWFFIQTEDQGIDGTEEAGNGVRGPVQGERRPRTE